MSVFYLGLFIFFEIAGVVLLLLGILLDSGIVFMLFGIMYLIGGTIGLIVYFVKRKAIKKTINEQAKTDEENLKFFYECLSIEELEDIEKYSYMYIGSRYEEKIDEPLKKYCIDNNLNFDESKKKYLDGRNVHEKNAATYVQLNKQSYEIMCMGLPSKCPKCSKEMVEVASRCPNPINKYYPDSIIYKNLWEEVATVETQTTQVSDAWTLGGATTVFTQNEKRTIKQYKCPKCGYLYIKG